MGIRLGCPGDDGISSGQGPHDRLAQSHGVSDGLVDRQSAARLQREGELVLTQRLLHRGEAALANRLVSGEDRRAEGRQDALRATKQIRPRLGLP